MRESSNLRESNIHWLIKTVAVLVVISVCALAVWVFRPLPGELAPTLVDVRDALTEHAYQFPVSYEDHLAQLRSFESRGGRIAYIDVGPGNASKTLLMIHGVPTSSWMYRKIIDALAGKLRVVAVDLLGYGASAKPTDPLALYEHAAQAGYVQELLAALEIQETALLVHDMGGLVGWELLRANAAVTDVILLNTIIHQQGFNHPNMSRGVMSEMITKAYSSTVSGQLMLKNTFDELGLTADFELTEAECWGYIKPLQSGSEDALYAFFTGLNATLFKQLNENKELMAEWPVRWRVFWGMKDSILTAEQLQILKQHAGVTDQDITEFPQNHHFLAEEAPDEVARGVLDFLGLEY